MIDDSVFSNMDAIEFTSADECKEFLRMIKQANNPAWADGIKKLEEAIAKYDRAVAKHDEQTKAKESQAA